MKKSKIRRRLFSFLSSLSLIGLAITLAPEDGTAQGMSPEIRDNIHTLFDQHSKVIRKVTLTENGYVALTESKDPNVAKVLRSHVKQMSERLQSGRMIRGWDPAFREMVQHYDDLTHKVETTTEGLKITVQGTTEAAIKVAQNHAKIITRFAENGWAEHDVRHPRATGVKTDSQNIGTQIAKACSEHSCCLTQQSTESADKSTPSNKEIECQKCSHGEKSEAIQEHAPKL